MPSDSLDLTARTRLFLTTGRILLAVAVLAFGVQHAVAGHLVDGLPPLPVWLPGGRAVAYAMAVLLIIPALALLANWRTKHTALDLGLFLLLASLLHLTHFNRVVVDAGVRTNFLQPLAFAAAALVLYGILAAPRMHWTLPAGCDLFALAMILFGVEHFLDLHFIAAMVPAWTPFHTFWVIFTGVAFIAAGIAIATGYLARAASIGLSAMFFVFLALMQIPACIATPRSSDAWLNFFLLIGLCGSSLLFAAVPHPQHLRFHHDKQRLREPAPPTV